jgi:exopolysaccharide biosynthesis polyprenyl glycosylphosphotransferase
MATSEYIPARGSAPRVAAKPSAARGGFIQASLLTPLPMVFSDVAAILLALCVALVVRPMVLDDTFYFADIWHSFGKAPVGLLYLAWFVLVYVLVARRYGLYGQILKSSSGQHELRMTAQACLVAGMLLCGALFITRDLAISRALVLLLTCSTMIFLCASRTVCRANRYRQYERGLSTRHIAILGANQLSRDLGRQISRESRLGYTLRGYVLAPDSERGPDTSGMQVIGELSELGRIARKYFLDEIVIAEQYPIQTVVGIIKEAGRLGIDVRTLCGYYTDLAPHSGIEYLGYFPLVALHRNTPRTIAVALKRAGDIALSLLALIAALPTMLAVAIAIRLEGPGPIFYTAERIGRRGRIFPCFKFRTMVSNADQLRKEMEGLNERDGVLFKMKNDPRITPLGRFLRKYSLDELPQFFNVLRGEMSLVGPRPPLASEVEKYDLEHLRRLEVPPGLTGLWQVQARQDASFEKYIALDTAYVENWSFWLDMKILWRTAEVVMRGTGT